MGKIPNMNNILESSIFLSMVLPQMKLCFILSKHAREDELLQECERIQVQCLTPKQGLRKADFLEDNRVENLM